MILSKETMIVLSNANEINNQIFIESGSTILTGAETKEIILKSDIAEKFEEDVGIYDLGGFLSFLKNFKDSNITFHGNRLDINYENMTQRFMYSSRSVVESAKKFLDFDDAKIIQKFMLTGQEILRIKKASSSNGARHFSLNGNKIVLGEVENRSETWDPISNLFILELDSIQNDMDCLLYFPIENLKILPIDYEVGISFSSETNGMKMMHFRSLDDNFDIQYMISLSFNSWVEK